MCNGDARSERKGDLGSVLPVAYELLHNTYTHTRARADLHEHLLLDDPCKGAQKVLFAEGFREPAIKASLHALPQGTFDSGTGHCQDGDLDTQFPETAGLG